MFTGHEEEMEWQADNEAKNTCIITALTPGTKPGQYKVELGGNTSLAGTTFSTQFIRKFMDQNEIRISELAEFAKFRELVDKHCPIDALLKINSELTAWNQEQEAIEEEKDRARNSELIDTLFGGLKKND